MSLSEKLFDAARANDARETARLLQEGADVGSLGVSDLTPLHVCGVADSHFVAAELLRQGADPEALDQRNRTALHAAALALGYKVMRLLLDARVDIEPRDQDGKTPLANLAWNGGEEGVRMMLEAGADPNALDFKGRCPLLLAMKAGHRNMAVLTLLVRAGANPRLKDEEGQSAMSLAEFTENHDAIYLFNSSMGIAAKSAPKKEKERPKSRPQAGANPFAKTPSSAELLDEPVTTVGIQSQLERQRARKTVSASGTPVNVKRRVIPF